MANKYRAPLHLKVPDWGAVRPGRGEHNHSSGGVGGEYYQLVMLDGY